MAIHRNKGFTLIELVVGMAVLAIAMLLMSTLLVSQSKNSLAPLHQMRAAQFAQSLLLHISEQPYEQVVPSLLSIPARDVSEDEFKTIFTYQPWLGLALGKEYQDYLLKLTVVDLSSLYSAKQMKRIDVVIKTPDEQEIAFSVLKGVL